MIVGEVHFLGNLATDNLVTIFFLHSSFLKQWFGPCFVTQSNLDT